MLYSEITDKIINSFYKVYNLLGYGFLENVYEKAFVIELKNVGFNVLQQQN
ncbi:PD-(D/E)XK nuclease superfamily protein [uncultured archaeon]|nr:PD-(D/E)XK nuclease superfamily protein [uncultured archaeon]